MIPTLRFNPFSHNPDSPKGPERLALLLTILFGAVTYYGYDPVSSLYDPDSPIGPGDQASCYMTLIYRAFLYYGYLMS
jgi:hypothetical protein